MGHLRPEINEQHIDQVRQLLRDHPDWHRSRLSVELCELWGWKSDTGQLKDISCRDLLRSLECAGEIKLPQKRRLGAVKAKSGEVGRQLSLFSEAPQPMIETNLKAVMPVAIEIADARDKISEFKSYIDQYHYLAYGRSVGECIRYLVRSRDAGEYFSSQEIEEYFRCFLDILDRGDAEYQRAIEGKQIVVRYNEEKCLLRRLREYADEHLRFITNPNVPRGNNGAERGAKEAKRKVRVSGGFRSDKGADNYARSTSVIGTMRKNDMDVFQGLKDILNGETLSFGFQPCGSG
jgi:hypothetical protein